MNLPRPDRLAWSVVLALLVAGPGISRAGEAEKALGVLRTYCYSCHGKLGRDEGGLNFAIDGPRLVRSGLVTPKEPEKSRLLARMASGEMPPAADPLVPDEPPPRPSPDDVATVRRWIASGAEPAALAVWKSIAPGPSEAARLIESDLKTAAEADRRHFRYFTLANRAALGDGEDALQGAEAPWPSSSTASPGIVASAIPRPSIRARPS